MYCASEPLRRRAACSALVAATAALLAACGTTAPGARHVEGRLTHDAASDVAVHALGLVGTPYRYGGNTPDGGFDCSGLIGYVYRHGVTPVLAPRTVAQLAGWGGEVDRSGLRSGDLVVFGARSTHAGIYVGEGRFVHAPSTGGTVRLDRLDGPYWSRQPVAFRRP